MDLKEFFGVGHDDDDPPTESKEFFGYGPNDDDPPPTDTSTDPREE